MLRRIGGGLFLLLALGGGGLLVQQTFAAPAAPPDPIVLPTPLVVYVVVTATPEPTEVPTATPEPSPTPEPTLVVLTRTPVPTVLPDMGQLDLAPTARGGERPRDFDYISPARCWNEPSGEGCWTDTDVRDALAGASPMVHRIFFCESGRSGLYRPYAIGGQQERGPVQLLPGRGNGLATYFAMGFTDESNPLQGRAWLERVIATPGMLQQQYPRTSQGCVGSV